MECESAGLPTGLCSDTSSCLIDNPESLGDGFCAEEREDAGDNGKNRVAVLTRQAQHNNSVVISGRIGFEVGEVEIEGDEDTLLFLTDPGDG